MGAKKLEALDLVPVASEASSVNYVAMEKERTAILQAEIEAKLRAESAVKGHSLQKLVLQSVVHNDYEKAKADIENYITYKSRYPNYPRKVKKHSNHCRELIDAIKVKRNFPGLSTMSMSKQKEILDHVVSHFDELKQGLKIMEKIAGEVMLADLRSTAWVLRVFSYTIMMIAVVAFLIGFEKEVGLPVWIHFNVMADDLFNSFWRFFTG